MKVQLTEKQQSSRRGVTVAALGNGLYRIEVEGAEPLDVEAVALGPNRYLLQAGDRVREFIVAAEKNGFCALSNRGRQIVELLDERQLAREALGAGSAAVVDGKATISSPMPGRVVKCLVAEDDSVVVGQGLIIVEAMKMENELKSPIDGRVKSIKAQAGGSVEAGEALIHLEAFDSA
ncbi:MAG: biotin/lipoyl-binding protein [Deltaproteobacteria bacterium]|nr:biotin/lipoyl-binding protein [Deltaproteobacteria bacterium]